MIALACTVAYIVIGVLLGQRDVLYFLADQRRRYPALHDPDYKQYSDTPELKLERARSTYGEAAGWWALWIAFWPIMFLTTRIKRTRGGKLIEQIEHVDTQERAMKEAAEWHKRLVDEGVFPNE